MSKLQFPGKDIQCHGLIIYHSTTLLAHSQLLLQIGASLRDRLKTTLPALSSENFFRDRRQVDMRVNSVL